MLCGGANERLGGRGSMWKDEPELFLRVPGGMEKPTIIMVEIGILILKLSCDCQNTRDSLI